ncbi:hypothetical protein [Cellulomonas carbonis]|uniref:Uncharacterized protein n=1 Tax=Cellulomonas carbonis T26 TaxID=947969 RepID=A0A0A0BUI5_9CELL|nr:hypothetical protein [Cellulomonas carbonis]KGM11591.1 hypothetical protein N868_05325 [Cellulomonas carbonis T26]GGC06616.1 hypothetical protein GCM10010972_19790 [Cellulomonas carbonis]
MNQWGWDPDSVSAAAGALTVVAAIVALVIGLRQYRAESAARIAALERDSRAQAEQVTLSLAEESQNPGLHPVARALSAARRLNWADAPPGANYVDVLIRNGSNGPVSLAFVQSPWDLQVPIPHSHSVRRRGFIERTENHRYGFHRDSLPPGEYLLRVPYSHPDLYPLDLALGFTDSQGRSWIRTFTGRLFADTGS